MNTKIFKYTISENIVNVIEMPIGAKVLSIQEQHGEICIWALVDDNEVEKENRVFEVWVTGAEIYFDKEKEFLETVQLYNGSIVLHVFEVKESQNE